MAMSSTGHVLHWPCPTLQVHLHLQVHPAQAARPPAGSSCLHFKLSCPKPLPRRSRCQLPAQPEWGLHMSLPVVRLQKPLTLSALFLSRHHDVSALFRAGLGPSAPSAASSYFRQRPSLQHPGRPAWGPRGPSSLPLVHAMPVSSHSPMQGVKRPLTTHTLKGPRPGNTSPHRPANPLWVSLGILEDPINLDAAVLRLLPR